MGGAGRQLSLFGEADSPEACSAPSGPAHMGAGAHGGSAAHQGAAERLQAHGLHAMAPGNGAVPGGDATETVAEVQAELPPEVRLARLALEASECRRCRLRAGCRQVVFGEGNPRARLMFVGEGPGEQEDLEGRPFVGRAGQLLDRILEAAGFHRADVYITNVVKCRPPGNRTPTPDEAEACWFWLQQQLALIQPRWVVCLGATAARRLVDPEASISRLRGRWIERDGIQYLVTFHPAALLRNPQLKKPAWEDFLMVRAAYLEEAGGKG